MTEDRPKRGFRDYARNFFTNWEESEDPLAVKVWLTIRNRTKGTVTGRFCCGHHGEPGC